MAGLNIESEKEFYKQWAIGEYRGIVWNNGMQGDTYWGIIEEADVDFTSHIGLYSEEDGHQGHHDIYLDYIQEVY